MPQIGFGGSIRPLHAAQQRVALSGGHAVVLVIIGPAQFRVEAQLASAVAALDLEADAAVALPELFDVHLSHQLPARKAVDGECLGVLHVGIAQGDGALPVTDGGRGLAVLRSRGGGPVGGGASAAARSAPGGEAGCQQ